MVINWTDEQIDRFMGDWPEAKGIEYDSIDMENIGNRKKYFKEMLKQTDCKYSGDDVDYFYGNESMRFKPQKDRDGQEVYFSYLMENLYRHMGEIQRNVKKNW